GRLELQAPSRSLEREDPAVDRCCHRAATQDRDDGGFELATWALAGLLGQGEARDLDAAGDRLPIAAALVAAGVHRHRAIGVEQHGRGRAGRNARYSIAGYEGRDGPQRAVRTAS